MDCFASLAMTSKRAFAASRRDAGRQDHTILPSAATSFVSAPFDRSQILVGPALHHVSRLTLPRPPHPMPNVRDDRDTPLCG